jgi:hypothetical protein
MLRTNSNQGSYSRQWRPRYSILANLDEHIEKHVRSLSASCRVVKSLFPKNLAFPPSFSGNKPHTCYHLILSACLCSTHLSQSTNESIDFFMKHANYPHFSCIDAENIPAFHGEEVLWNVNRFPGTTRIYGSKASLRNWQRVIEDYALESKQHRGGKQAADELILADACYQRWRLRTRYADLSRHGLLHCRYRNQSSS